MILQLQHVQIIQGGRRVLLILGACDCDINNHHLLDISGKVVIIVYVSIIGYSPLLSFLPKPQNLDFFGRSHGQNILRPKLFSLLKRVHSTIFQKVNTNKNGDNVYM